MSMKLNPKEIESVDKIGVIDEDEVRLVRTVGGLYLAIGKPRGKKQEEVLAAGSHPAIVKYNIEKSYNGYQPSMEKSEHNAEETVIGVSELLPLDMRKKGYELFSLEKSNNADVVLTKHGLEVTKYELTSHEDAIEISKASTEISPEIRGVASAVIQVSARKAMAQGKDKLEHAGRTFDVAKVFKK